MLFQISAEHDLFITAHKAKKGETNKMDGIFSCNTAASYNPFCLDMHSNPETICSSGYCFRYENMRPNAKERYRLNGETLKKRIPKNRIPIFASNMSPFRWQAFGDLLNCYHLDNIYKVVDANDHIRFAIWTKRLDIVERVGLQVFDNLQWVYSSLYPNTIVRLEDLPTGFNSVFIVWSKQGLRDNPKIKINCSKKCYPCQRCYKPSRVIYTHEQLK